jgi:molecular chaperone HtpG
MTTTENNTRKQFQAEVSQVLDLVINSLYSNKDIFLRELISNSSDALDKLRFNSLTNPALAKDDLELGIKLSINEDSKQIIIQDNGIGMNEEELVNNLGTIAKSGTKEFIKKIKDSKDASFNSNLIGQFGVGFYSAFIVADNVTVVTKKAGEDSIYKWASDAKADYEIAELRQEELNSFGIESLDQGTAIILNIKDDEEAKEYLSNWKLRSIVKKYSDFVEYPIKLKTVEKKDDTEEVLWEILNSQKAIWTKNPTEIKAEEYEDFYKHLSHDYNKPLDQIHYRAEGTNEFTALLYLPEKAGMDLFMQEGQKGLSLYINRVFISNEADLLLPQYLRFVKGVVDSSDLPLNVSREILQQNQKVLSIKKNLTKKILSRLGDILKQEPEKYKNFFSEFGKVIKEGVHTDFANKDKILDLLVYETTKTKAGETISLAEYLERMPSDSENIYFITGESRADLESSPYLEALKAKDIEVIFMTDPIDEWVTMSGGSYKEKSFKSATKGEVNLENKQELEKKTEEFKDLLSKVKDALEDKVAEVKFSDRLVDTVACLVTGENDMSAHMEKIFKAANQKIPSSARTLELNPNHKVVQKLSEILEESSDNPKIKDYSELIYGQALLLEGSKIPDLARFSKLISDLMA